MHKLLAYLTIPAALALGPATASAAPGSLGVSATNAVDSARSSHNIVQVRRGHRHWRRGHRWHRHHHAYRPYYYYPRRHYWRRYHRPRYYPSYYYPRYYYPPVYYGPRFGIHIGF